MTPRVEPGRRAGKNELIQDDICPEELLAGKVPHESARHFLLCVAKSPLEQAPRRDDSMPIEETIIH